MKKFLVILITLAAGFQAAAQNCYWVFFTDKQNTSFNPYEYFDAKAVGRYERNHASLYDISNYPVNGDYKVGVLDFAAACEGESRWLNAVAVEATDYQIQRIADLPYVAGVSQIASEAEVAGMHDAGDDVKVGQVAAMEGEKFISKGYAGKGVRIAVLDEGFASVDRHPAFKHLRDNSRIVKTYNFMKKKEDVYNDEVHGGRVLSCLGGIMNDSRPLGLAPESEYLLAVVMNGDRQNKKSEIRWVEALEWADRNGADIVNSSVGITAGRYEVQDLDGRTSIMARAASTAARKGILLCAAMGNNGGRYDNWKMMLTPADADSVLSVGATHNDDRYRYSSYGPTADGRMKPNVAACGYTTVAGENGNYQTVTGTSYASPLVAGFAACVMQMHPDWPVMKVLQEIERSGEHYPYFDYALGYGVPQAGYFTDAGGQSGRAYKFDLYEDDRNVYIVLATPSENAKIYYNIQNGDGSLAMYDMVQVSENVARTNYVEYDEAMAMLSEIYAIVRQYEDAGPAEKNWSSISSVYDRHEAYLQLQDTLADQQPRVFAIAKSGLKDGQTLNVWCGGDTKQYVVGKSEIETKDFKEASKSTRLSSQWGESVPEEDFYSKKHKLYDTEYRCTFGVIAGFPLASAYSNEGVTYKSKGISGSMGFVIGNHWNLARSYGLGLSVGFGSAWYALADSNALNESIYPNNVKADDIIKDNFKATKFDFEFYQRFHLCHVETESVYMDLGFYCGVYTGCRSKIQTREGSVGKLYRDQHKLKDYNYLNAADCGVRLRVGYTEGIAVYGQYRITDMLKTGKCPNLKGDLPEFEVGVIFGF